MGHKCIEPMLFIYMVQISIACSYRLYFAINIIKFVPFYRNNFVEYDVYAVYVVQTQSLYVLFFFIWISCAVEIHTRARAAHHPVHTM